MSRFQNFDILPPPPTRARVFPAPRARPGASLSNRALTLAEPVKTTQTVSLPQAFGLARQRHAAGDLQGAQEVYRRILNVAPDHVEVLTMLASIAYREGRDGKADSYLTRALDLSRQALRQRPDDASLRASLVNLLLARDQVSEAEALAKTLNLPLNPIRAAPEDFASRRRDGIGRGLPAILITTVPKSASESMWNKLAEGLGLAQCYLSLGLFPDCCLLPSRVRAAAEGGVVVKEHIGATPHNLETLSACGIERVIVHLRDPRQAALSWAHFARDDINRRLMAPLWRKIVPPAAVLEQDLGAQIDWCVDAYLPHLVAFLRGWMEVDRDPAHAISVLFLSFEQFRTEPKQYFDRVLQFYGIEKTRFAEDADAKVVHLRKGLVDEWRGVFTETQRRRAWKQIPNGMAKAFGWEP